MSKCSFRSAKAALLLVFTCLLCALPAPVYAAGPYVTNEFEITMDVKEDYSFYMTYRIAVDFNIASHGIYCYIPLDSDYRIDRINVPGNEFQMFKEDDNLVIKIGSPVDMITGDKEYIIEYRCRFFADNNPDYDFLYWNLLSPGGWDTDIESFSVKILMPKPFAEEYVMFTGGRLGSSELADLDVNIDGKTITAVSVRPVAQGDGITCAVMLPEGYFQGAMTRDIMWALLVSCMVFAAIGTFSLWFLFGRDPKIIQTVEFYPPEGLTPAEVGYVIDGVVDKKDILSMIIYFADKGFLSIDGGTQDGKTISLIKNIDLPEEAKTYEHTLFNGLFAEKDRTDMSELKGRFYPHYIAAFGQLNSLFKQGKNRIFTLSSTMARLAGMILTVAPIAAFMGLLSFWHGRLSYIFMCLPIVALMAVGLIYIFNVHEKRDSLGGATKTVRTAIGAVASIIGFSGFTALGFRVFGIGPEAIIAAICSLVSFVFTVLMKRRTKRGAELFGKILGFKDFIRLAELDRLKKLVAENPSYFYDVLPYAYVFGLSNMWAKNFDGIDLEPPMWYVNNRYDSRYAFSSMVFMNSFGNVTSSISQGLSIPRNNGSHSGGSGFGGGGFKGVSTGGGSGGFGGGRW